MTTLTEFISFVKRNGVARQNRFRLTFNLPQSVIDKMGQELGTSFADGFVRQGITESQNRVNSSTLSSYALAVMCQSVTLPGTTVSTQDMVAQNSTRKMPFDKSYTDFECTYISSGNMIEKKVFDSWIGVMFNKDHTVAYFDDYVVDILVEVLNEADQVVYTYKLTECYPSAINPLSLDRSVTNQYQVFNVSFNFTKPKRIEDEFGTVRRSFIDQTSLGGVGFSSTLGTALRLPEQPQTGNFTAAALDVVRSIEEIKAQVEQGMSPRSAEIMFRGVLRELDGIETFTSFEHGALSGYIQEIIDTLSRS